MATKLKKYPASIAPFGIETHEYAIIVNFGRMLQSHLLVLKHFEFKAKSKQDLQASIAPFGIETFCLQSWRKTPFRASIAPFGIETNYFLAYRAFALASIAPFGIETSRIVCNYPFRHTASIAPFGIETYCSPPRHIIMINASIAPFGIEILDYHSTVKTRESASIPAVVI